MIFIVSYYGNKLRNYYFDIMQLFYINIKAKKFFLKRNDAKYVDY